MLSPTFWSVLAASFSVTVWEQSLDGSPESSAVQKQMEIDRKDERNIMIRNAAKSKAYDVMTFVFGALLIAIGLMSPGLAPFLLLVFAYLFVLGTGIYFRIKFEKKCNCSPSKTIPY